MVMKIDKANICLHKDGPYIEIEETPLTAVIVPELVMWACGKLSDRVCTPPDWAYELRWGPKDPEYHIADKSLGHYWYEFGQWSHLGFGTHRKTRVVAKIPVTRQWVTEHYPEMLNAMTLFGEDDDEMDVELPAPRDPGQGVPPDPPASA